MYMNELYRALVRKMSVLLQITVGTSLGSGGWQQVRTGNWHFQKFVHKSRRKQFILCNHCQIKDFQQTRTKYLVVATL